MKHFFILVGALLFGGTAVFVLKGMRRAKEDIDDIWGC